MEMSKDSVLQLIVTGTKIQNDCEQWLEITCILYISTISAKKNVKTFCSAILIAVLYFFSIIALVYYIYNVPTLFGRQEMRVQVARVSVIIMIIIYHVKDY